ncbi:RING/U-box superfamily protein [Euphorbia peplus]|nr:RING/U-box superfamily protein [Euphorbia peplus]
MSILWFGLVLFGILSVAFTVYALILLGRCSCLPELSDPGSTFPAEENSVSLNLSPYSSSTFKYKKGRVNTETQTAHGTECVVCLSVFEDEEYVRQLPICRHSFHALCIDKWLYSHSDCPICRRPIHRMDYDDVASASKLAAGSSMDSQLDIRISF